MADVVALNKKSKSIKEWRIYISEPWQKAVESIIETGRRLIEARDSVEYGKWEQLFEDNKPFSVITARRLIAIAEHPILSNRTHVYGLPPSWGTLYELSRIPAEDLQKLIETGKVHPELTRDEAETLKTDERKQKEDAENLLAILFDHAFRARELSLADCSGSSYDCSILKGNVSQEIMDAVQGVIDAWTKLHNHLHSLK